MNENNNDVLALFNGMSCGRIALDRAGIKYGNYYSSETDKFCKQVTSKNYPDTFELGDINYWQNWGIDFSKIGLITAGFPCQAWSVAGKQKGDSDPSGQLVHKLIEVWKYVRKLNPDVKFIFENVKMKKEFIKYINELFGVEPILINSALVSAQNRNRLYWTNIPVKQPGDKKIFLKDIVAWSRSTRYPKNKKKYVESRTRADGKSNTLTTGQGCGSFSSKNYTIEENNLSTKEKSDLSANWFIWWNKNYKKKLDKKFSFIINQEKKAICLTARHYANWNGNFVCENKSLVEKYKMGDEVVAKIGDLRKLTPIECERLQTIPDNYTKGVSESQRYKMIGNGWTIDVMAHILNGLK